VKRQAHAAESGPSEAVESVATTRVARGVASPRRDVVAREEPLEIQLDGRSLAVVMRTPGDDPELALGLLWSEGVIRSLADVVSVRHATQARDPDGADNILQVRLREGLTVDWRRLQRNLYASASCGVCGKATIDGVLGDAPPLEDDSTFAASVLGELPERLLASQAAFAETGGLHGAGLCDHEGRLLVVREDVGRHNAVDKVVGWALRAGKVPLAGHALVVSGRISYEIAVKALAARVPLVAAVSAPSSLAVTLAERSRLTLVGFLRGESFNVYGERRRVVVARG